MASLTESGTPFGATIALPPDAIAATAQWLRRRAFELVLNAGSGHLGAAGSSAELLAALYFSGHLRVSTTGGRWPGRDRVLIRGHVGPLRYPLFSLLGYIAQNELDTYRQLGSRLQGHEDHLLVDGVDISPSGSLGMLLSYGVGALLTREAAEYGFRAFVCLGDGEEQEGNVSEAARYAAHRKLNRLVAILDQNGKQLSCSTLETCSTNIVDLWRGYGWHTIIVEDGHDVRQIVAALREAVEPRHSPSLIVARTEKGKGITGARTHVSGFHTLGVTPREAVVQAIEDLRRNENPGFDPYMAVHSAIKPLDSLPPRTPRPARKPVRIPPEPGQSGDPTAAQTAYFRRLGEVLRADARPCYFLTADVTYYSGIKEAAIDTNMAFFNVGLREQHMIAMAHGISVTEPDALVIVNTSDAFTYRGMDQLNAAAQGGGRLLIVSDVAGITEGRNGRTHQTSGQPGAVLAIPGLTVMEPSDSEDLHLCLDWAVTHADGPVFVRVSRGAVTDWASASRRNVKCYRCFWPDQPHHAVIVASGMPVSAAVQAAQQFAMIGQRVGVVNVIQQKALDHEFLTWLPEGKPVLTVYNGHPAVLQQSVSAAILAEPNLGRPSLVIGLGFIEGTSGSPAELAARFGIDCDGIVRRLTALLEVG